MELNVAYSCNEGYVPHTGISIISLLENNKSVDTIKIYFIEKDVSKDSLELLKRIAYNYGRQLIIISFSDIAYNLKVENCGRHIETVYAKLYFGNISGVDKLLYIDSDTVVIGSLVELFQTNMESNLFGLVKTITKDSVLKLGLEKSDPFYNDGIALVNVKLLRENEIEQKFNDLIKQFNGDPPVLSEGVINVVCKNKILTIHPKYNFSPIFYMFSKKKLREIEGSNHYYSDEEIDDAINNPIIIHYLSGWFKRPWELNCTHPLKKEYLYFKSISPWSDIPLSKPHFNIKALRMKIFHYLPISVMNFLKSNNN